MIEILKKLRDLVAIFNKNYYHPLGQKKKKNSYSIPGHRSDGRVRAIGRRFIELFSSWSPRVANKNSRSHPNTRNANFKLQLVKK